MIRWIGGGLIATAIYASSAAVSIGQAQATAEAGYTNPSDIVFARRILMDMIARNNDVIHESIDGVLPWDLQEIRARLGSISAMLLAFPHLYRPDTKIWSEELEAANPAAVTLSLPTVWEQWDDFVQRANTASQTAHDASWARSEEEVIRLTEELEVQCEACHVLYRQDRPAPEFPE